MLLGREWNEARSVGESGMTRAAAHAAAAAPRGAAETRRCRMASTTSRKPHIVAMQKGTAK